MNCPVCREHELSSTDLDSDLAALHCANCGGNFLRGANYWNWLETHGENLPEQPPAPDEPQPGEDVKAKLCPECRAIMIKYHVGHETTFTLDQCPACKGIWLDRNEWEILKSRNLHDDLNRIVTEPWQLEAHRDEKKRRLEQLYATKFGAEDYAELKRIREWLDQHAKRQELLAFLSDENPLD